MVLRAASKPHLNDVKATGQCGDSAGRGSGAFRAIGILALGWEPGLEQTTYLIETLVESPYLLYVIINQKKAMREIGSGGYPELVRSPDRLPCKRALVRGNCAEIMNQNTRLDTDDKIVKFY